jgi:4-hydroxy-L-threonine phosphate dehydrogenase PdxA
MFNRAINALFGLAILFVFAAPATIYGQREPRDRPDTVGSRSIGGKEATQSRRDRKAAVDPETKVDQQLISAPKAANADAMRRATVTAAGLTNPVTNEEAIEAARREYESRFKPAFDDETFKNSHAAIRLEDFARAYIIALNSTVKAKITEPYDLAVLRSMTTTYDGYEEILRDKVPELSEKDAEKLIDDAKKIVKAALSKP